MKLKDNALIIGNVLLFASAGCGGTTSSSSTDTDGNVPRDAETIADSTATADGTVSDLGTPPDLGSGSDSALPDTGPSTDSTVVAMDSGTTEPDASEIDAAVSTDSEVEADVFTPVLDMSIAVDSGNNAGACADLTGEPCRSERPDFGCCEAGQIVLTCVNGVYSEQAADPLCGCGVLNGPTELFCAVPGFVGIDRAGRGHQTAPSLRSLLRNA